MYPGSYAASTPDKPAAVVVDASGRSLSTLTYRQLDGASLRLAHVFRSAGLRRGDVVGLVTDNRLEAFEVYWAALRSGLYFTAVNHHLTAEEARSILRDAGVKALVVSAGKAELAAALRNAASETGVAVFLAYRGGVPGYDHDGCGGRCRTGRWTNPAIRWCSSTTTSTASTPTPSTCRPRRSTTRLR